ncbi:MAG: hypothetical protein JXR76_31805 [Deltaproteobacteria bacterium]|nr:hypothetical protein [Deltaproteobacteria bacterium]
MTTIGSEEAYERCYDAFMAIKADKVVNCNIPTDIAVADARELALCALDDRVALMGAGIDADAVDTLADRAGAFSCAAARYEAVLNSDPVTSEKWCSLQSVAYEIQRYLIRYLSFAYRRDRSLYTKVAIIRNGMGPKDMVMDLLALALLAEANPAPLRRIPAFDFEKLKEAKKLHNAMSELLAIASIDPGMLDVTQEVMNRSYTYYRVAADEVKEYGRFVFGGTRRAEHYAQDSIVTNTRKRARLAVVNDHNETEAV